ncbi:MAG: DnaJ domain-containing protein [Chloroherpetonaceae bacterium]|nr:DnaJ domain-containing protein [Chloroherpetonaceae bacterium]
MQSPNQHSEGFIDYYELLGLTYKASPDEIRKAYMQFIKTVHPDKLQNIAEEDRVKAEKLAQFLNQAKETLLDPAKRAEYDIQYMRSLSDAAAFASKKGFDGSRFNEYAANSSSVESMRDATRGNSKVARNGVLVLILLMSGLSILWRFVKPEDITDKPREVLRFIPAINQGEIKLSFQPRIGEVFGFSNLIALAFSDSNQQNHTLRFYESTPSRNGIEVTAPFFEIPFTSAITTITHTKSSLFIGTSSGEIFEIMIDEIAQRKVIQKLLHQFPEPVTALAVSNESPLLMIATRDKSLHFYDLKNTQLKRSFGASIYAISSLAIASHLDNEFICYANDAQIMSQRIQDGSSGKSILRSRRRLNPVASSKDWVAATGEDKIIRQIHIPTSTIRAGDPETSLILDLIYSTNGALLSAAGSDGIIRLYRRESPKKLETLSAHLGGVFRTRFSSQSDFLVSFGADSTIKFWDLIKVIE